jgi:hypothetical protein
LEIIPRRVSKRKIKMMSEILLTLGAATSVLFLSALHAQSATITAASPAQHDVAAAVASANDGDTVQIPAGGSTWTSGLTITKAITLRGQGVSNTFLRRHGGLLILQPANNLPIRVTGIYFDMSPFNGSDGDRPGIILYGTCTSLRIDHCYFVNGERAVFIVGKGYGVTDHCTFRDNYISVMPDMAGADDGSTSWAESIHPGGQDTMVVEDCNFINDQGTPDDTFVEAELYGQNGARCCVRHCTFDYTNTGSVLNIDAHGYSPSWGHGTRFYEIYNNVFHSKVNYRFVYLRGGVHIWHDNQFITDSTAITSSPVLIALTREDVGYPSGKGSTQELITQSFFWNNSNSVGGNSATVQGAVDAGTNPNEPVLDTDYFNRAIQSGDPWYPYTPLVYPHPLVTAQDGMELSAPENLRVIGSGS